MASATDSRRVIVSLHFIPNTPTECDAIKSEFSALLPLQDLQWRSSTRNTTRSIDNLDLDFKAFSEISSDSRQLQIPLNLLDKPYLHLLFVHCDVSDQSALVRNLPTYPTRS